MTGKRGADMIRVVDPEHYMAFFETFETLGLSGIHTENHFLKPK